MSANPALAFTTVLKLLRNRSGMKFFVDIAMNFSDLGNSSVYDETRSVLEPHGALAIAGARQWLSHQDAGSQDVSPMSVVAIARSSSFLT